MYELPFKRVPKYGYKAKIAQAKHAQPNEQQPVMHGFFIRRHRIQSILKATDDLGSLQRHFKIRILTNFLNKIHVPIQKDQALVSAHRELYEQKLNVFFRDKVNHLFREHLGQSKLESDATAFLEKLKKSKVLNPKRIRELFFVEMQKFPALEEKMADLRFPKMATMMNHQAETQEEPYLRSSSEILRQQFLDQLKDPAIQALLQELKRGHAVLLVEHDMDAVFRIADRITVMVNGSVVATGTPAQIRVDPVVRTAYLGEDDD